MNLRGVTDTNTLIQRTVCSMENAEIGSEITVESLDNFPGNETRRLSCKSNVLSDIVDIYIHFPTSTVNDF